MARTFSLFCFFLLIPTIKSTYKYEDFREEDVVGLEEFLSKLDEDVQELVIELLEAKEIKNTKEQDQMMRHIMRKQTPDSLEQLYALYKSTLPTSVSPSFTSVILSAIFPLFIHQL